MARFINNRPFVNLEYDPLSYDEINQLPMMLMERDEKNLNYTNEVLDSLDKARVVEDERALGFLNKTKEDFQNQANEIAKIITEKGSLDPNLMGTLRSMRRRYNTLVSPSGALGQLMDARKTIDDQRYTKKVEALGKGNTDEGFRHQFDNDYKSWSEKIDYDRLANDPNYQLERFIASGSPDRESVENIIARMDGALGSIGVANSDTGVTPAPDGFGGYTLTYTSSSTVSNSNREALENISKLLSLEIGDPNSTLMKNLMYNNPGKSFEELQKKAYEEASYRINARLRSNSSTAKAKDIQTIAGAKPEVTKDPNDPNKKVVKEEKSEELGELATQSTNYELSSDFKDMDYLTKVQSGMVGKELEALERAISEMPDGDLKNQRATELEKAKQKVAATRFVLAEATGNKANSKQLEASIQKAKNDIYWSTNKNDSKYRNYTLSLTKKPTKAYDYLTLGNFETLGDLINNYDNEIGKINISKHLDTVLLQDDKRPRLDPYSVSIRVDDPQGKIKTSKNVIRFDKDVTQDENGDYIVKTKGVSHVMYTGKEGIKEYLKSKGVEFTEQELDTYMKLKTDRDFLSFFNTKTIKHFVTDHFSKEENDMSLNSNLLLINTPKTLEKYNAQINSLGKMAVMNEWLNNEKTSIIYNSDGSVNRVRKLIDVKDDYDVDIDSIQNGDAKFGFAGIVERSSAHNPTILLSVEYGNADKKKTKTIGIEYTGGEGSVNDKLLQNLEESLGEPDRSKIKAIRNNTKYRGVYVDDASIGKNGVSKHQLSKMKTSLPDTLVRNEDYKAASPVMNAEKANIVVHKDGYHSFNYATGNTTKSVMLSDYLLKESVGYQIGIGTTVTGDTFKKESDIQALNVTSKPVASRLFVTQSIQLLQLIEDGSHRGVVKVANAEKHKLLMDLRQRFLTTEGQTLEMQLQLAKEMYDILKNVPLLHKDKLKGI